MNAHVARLINARFFGLTPFSKFSTWLNSKLQARRARLIEEEAIEYLKTLDRDLLKDMGVDISQLGKPTSTLAHCNPYVIATMAVMPAPPSSPSAKQRTQA